MSDLLQNHISTSHTIRTHAKKVSDNSGSCQSGRTVVTYDSKSDLPLGIITENSESLKLVGAILKYQIRVP